MFFLFINLEMGVRLLLQNLAGTKQRNFDNVRISCNWLFIYHYSLLLKLPAHSYAINKSLIQSHQDIMFFRIKTIQIPSPILS